MSRCVSRLTEAAAENSYQGADLQLVFFFPLLLVFNWTAGPLSRYPGNPPTC